MKICFAPEESLRLSPILSRLRWGASLFLQLRSTEMPLKNVRLFPLSLSISHTIFFGFGRARFKSSKILSQYLLHGSPINDDQAEFNELVYAYRVHQRMMQLSFSTIEQFLEEHNEGQKLRKWEPTDVKKLSEVELVGLLYWIEKQRPYKELPSEDKSALLMRYSVRKLSLDHFYSASKHPVHVRI